MSRCEGRCENGDGIEVTLEMVKAGEQVLLCELGGAVSSHWDARELAIAVYRSMASVDKPQNLSSLHGRARS